MLDIVTFKSQVSNML